MSRADRRPRVGRLAVAVPTAALLTLTAAGTAHAATLTAATPGGAFTLGDITFGSTDRPPPGVDALPTLAPPPAGTLLAETDVEDSWVGDCTTGPGNARRANIVARYPLGIGDANTTVFWQTLNFEHCRAPDGTITVGQPDANSGITGTGRTLGIEKVGDDPVQVIPPMGTAGSWHLIYKSTFRGGGLVPVPGVAGVHRLRMDVRINPQQAQPYQPRPLSLPCVASINGDSTQAICEDNDTGSRQDRHEDADPVRKLRDGNLRGAVDDLWKKLTGGR